MLEDLLEGCRERDRREEYEHGETWTGEQRPSTAPRRPTVGTHKGRLVERSVVAGRR